MNRAQAIEKIKAITGGGGFPDMDIIPDYGKGRLAKSLWFDCTFTYGAEYGAIAALMLAFDIKPEEIWEKCN